jgi:hypothetical protein
VNGCKRNSRFVEIFHSEKISFKTCRAEPGVKTRKPRVETAADDLSFPDPAISSASCSTPASADRCSFVLLLADAILLLGRA